MVHRVRREVKLVQAGVHLLQQPLCWFRARFSERVSQTCGSGRARLETIVERTRATTEQHRAVPEVTSGRRLLAGICFSCKRKWLRRAFGRVSLETRCDGECFS